MKSKSASKAYQSSEKQKRLGIPALMASQFLKTDFSFEGNVTGFKCIVLQLNLYSAVIEADIRSERLRQLGRIPYKLFIKSSVNGRVYQIDAKVFWIKKNGGRSLVGLKFFIDSTTRRNHRITISRLNNGASPYKEFVFFKRIYFGDTNVEGNVYFARYFEWQGMAREEFYRQALPGWMKLQKAGIHIITAHASISFKRQLRLFDEAKVIVKVSRIKTASLTLSFDYLNALTGIRIARGSQELTFAGENGAVILVPTIIRRAALPYYDPFDRVDARL